MIMEDSRGELGETIRNEQPEEEDFMRGEIIKSNIKWLEQSQILETLKIVEVLLLDAID